MPTSDLIIGLFIRVDRILPDVPKPRKRSSISARLLPSPCSLPLKAVGPRAFYHWISNNYRNWFPGLPDRTGLFRFFATHADWADYFLA
ncbi:MAG TPA: hypothetical protein VLA19_10095 [Herpetosiphonaceae bacterium]|nr:hypothetical protein [Herpetosiphonaceae bacterium]